MGWHPDSLKYSVVHYIFCLRVQRLHHLFVGIFSVFFFQVRGCWYISFIFLFQVTYCSSRWFAILGPFPAATIDFSNLFPTYLESVPPGSDGIGYLGPPPACQLFRRRGRRVTASSAYRVRLSAATRGAVNQTEFELFI